MTMQDLNVARSGYFCYNAQEKPFAEIKEITI